MVRAKIWFLSGDSLFLDLDPQEPVKILRAQLGSELKVPRFYEVKLLRLAQEAKVVTDSDEFILEVQALQVLSLTKVAEALEAVVDSFANAQTSKWECELEDPFFLTAKTVDAVSNALAPVDQLPLGKEALRVLTAMVALACMHNCLDDKRAERLGQVFGRISQGHDLEPCLNILLGRYRECNSFFFVRALARMAERKEISGQEHAERISAAFAEVLLSWAHFFFRDASEDCITETEELLAQFGGDVDVYALEFWCGCVLVEEREQTKRVVWCRAGRRHDRSRRPSWLQRFRA